MLATFAENPGRVLGHGQLLELVWGDRIRERDEVKLYVSYLRRKLGGAADVDPVETVRGVGYRYRPRLVKSRPTREREQPATDVPPDFHLAGTAVRIRHSYRRHPPFRSALPTPWACDTKSIAHLLVRPPRLCLAPGVPLAGREGTEGEERNRPRLHEDEGQEVPARSDAIVNSPKQCKKKKGEQPLTWSLARRAGAAGPEGRRDRPGRPAPPGATARSRDRRAERAPRARRATGRRGAG